MRTSLSSDQDLGAGHAIIRLEIGDIAVPSMPEGCAFSLQRASDALFLAQHGWQESHSSQIPDRIVKQGSLLELYVGSHVVDNLDVLDTYRIHLQHTSLAASVLHIESLTYSPLKGKEGLATAVAPALDVPAPPVIAEPEPEPEPEPQPMEEILPLSMATQSAPAQEGKKSPLLWIVLVVALLLAAGGYYWYSQKAKPAPEAATSSPAADAAASANNDANKDENKSATQGAQTSPEVLHPLAQARKQLQGNATAAQNLTLARTLQGQKPTDLAMAAQSADAIFLLVEDAAQKGSAEAMLILGQYFDPAATAPKGSIQPDVKQAVHWYTQARAKGQSEAADKALTALRAWAEPAAAQGNTTAQEALSLLPTK